MAFLPVFADRVQTTRFPRKRPAPRERRTIQRPAEQPGEVTPEPRTAKADNSKKVKVE